jgi:DUF1365 family protein
MKSASLMDTNQSLLLNGVVMHQRHRPIRHRFIYPLFALRLNLSQLKKHGSPLHPFLFGVNCLRPVSVFYKDHGPRTGDDLETWAFNLLRQAGCKNHDEIDGDIILQTFPRIFGFVFNPISLWYCHNKEGVLMAVIAEVSNTFGERHNYVLQAHDGKAIHSTTTVSCSKQMHVSPFCELKGHYEFHFSEHAHRSLVRIDYLFEDKELINTAMATNKLIFNNLNLIRMLIKFPFLSIGVVSRIHIQALRLWLKRVPFFHKPKQAPIQFSYSQTREECKHD